MRHLQDLVSILANSDYLFVSDVAVSRHRATGLLRDLALGLAVRNLSGEPLFDTCTADAEPFPVSRRPEEALYETDSAKSHISVVTKPVSGEPYLTIDLPVRREGESVWIVSLCALPRILQVLTEQHLPSGWTAVVADHRGQPIASIRESAGGSFAIVGSDQNMVSAEDSDPITAHGGSFDPGYVASSPVHLAGWTVAINVPGEIFTGPVRRAVFVLFVAGVGTFALMLVLAVTTGRRIAGSLTRLTGIAKSIGSGGRPALPYTGINEADLIAEVLWSTGEDLDRRTEQLTQTVAALRDREKQLSKLSDDLRGALDERTALLNRLISAQECERQRIARELHDHLGQYLAAMLLGLNAADKARSCPKLTELKAMTSAMSREVHHLSSELRPTALDDLGLESAMANYLEKWGERSNLDVDFLGNLHGRRLAAPIEITLYRVLQEGMTNVVKHANAKKISVVLDADDAEVRLVIEDDGTGFDRKQSGVLKRPPSGFGLLGMRERLVLRRIQRVQEGGRVWRGWHLRIGSRQTVLGEHCARQDRR